MYKLTGNHDETHGGKPIDFIIRKSDTAWIPKDPANTDYQEYLAWLDAVDEDGNKLGNTAEPAD
jgi:hypothetical protein